MIDPIAILPIPLILSQPDQAGRLQTGQQCAQLCFGVLVVLLDGEAEGFFQPRAGFFGTPQMKQAFGEKNAGHHPVSFFLGAKLQVLDGVGLAGLGEEGLREAEAKQFVVGLPGHQSEKMLGARGGGHQTSSTITMTPVALS